MQLDQSLRCPKLCDAWAFQKPNLLPFRGSHPISEPTFVTYVDANRCSVLDEDITFGYAA